MKIPKATFWKKRQDQNCALTPSTGLQDTGQCKRRDMGPKWSRQDCRHLDLGAWKQGCVRWWWWGGRERNKARNAMRSQAPTMWTEMAWGWGERRGAKHSGGCEPAPEFRVGLMGSIGRHSWMWTGEGLHREITGVLS